MAVHCLRPERGNHYANHHFLQRRYRLQVINLNIDERLRARWLVGRSQGRLRHFKQQAAALLRGYKIFGDIYWTASR